LADATSGADGMDFDEDDNLLMAHIRSGFIDVYAPNGGTPHQRIKCSFAKPSNIHFRKDTNTMYVYTEHENHGLWKLNGSEGVNRTIVTFK
jgi:sugar lactone lactonase YvrE